MRYPYKCPECDDCFEVEKPMDGATRIEGCPKCGQVLERKYVALPFSFGWRFTEQSHERFQPDTLERNV